MTPLMNTNAYLFLDSRAEGRPRAIADVDRMSRSAMTVGGSTVVTGEKVSLECGAEMTGLRRWATKTARGEFDKHDVRLSVVELGRKRAFFVEMHRVLIGSFTLPALDKMQKAPAFATVDLLPERTRTLAGAFSSDPKSAGYTGSPAIPWSASHFKLKIEGLETECAAANRIDAVAFGAVVKRFDASNVPMSAQWSSLHVSFPHSHLTRVQQWHRSVLGDRVDGSKAGSLEYFSAQGGSPVFKLSFEILPVALNVRGSGATLECAIESVQAES